MKLLIFTQKVDINDSMLSFFHRWIIELSKHFESVLVICLYKGESNLPSNVKVLSLGKESGESRYKYIKNFYRYIWEERNNYDKVFVHMNQEYVLLGGILLMILGKSVYMWRNHHSGSYLTDLAAVLCDKVFCTSKFSYTARYEETVLMPVGVDISNFSKEGMHKPSSILFLGRIAPVKKPHVLIEVFRKLKEDDINFISGIYGDPLPNDNEYYLNIKSKVKEFNLESSVTFYGGIPNLETPKIYSSYEIFINLSSNGMYDKTIFEAMASGCLVIASNLNLKGHIDDIFILESTNPADVYNKLRSVMNLSREEKEKAIKKNIEFAKTQDITVLGERIFKEINE